MLNDIHFLLTAGGTVLGVFISALLLFKKPSTNSTCVLGVFTLVLTVSLTEPLINKSLGEDYPFVLTCLGGLTLLCGPLLYLYCLERTHRPVSTKKVLMHMIPFFIYIVASTFTFFMNAGDSDVISLGVYAFLFMQVAWYVKRSMRLVNVFSNVGDDESSKITRMFMRVMIRSLAMLFFALFLVIAAQVFSLSITFVHYSLLMQLLLTVFILCIALLNSETMHLKKVVR